ncbi:MAG TPA: hypothetical protein VJN02_12095 [Gammaproteobacteria bacterium]|nr:hypothetical protein [Gammaproteobacteria bacterium]
MTNYDLQRMAKKLNHRPRKHLGYYIKKWELYFVSEHTTHNKGEIKFEVGDY